LAVFVEVRGQAAKGARPVEHDGRHPKCMRSRSYYLGVGVKPFPVEKVETFVFDLGFSHLAFAVSAAGHSLTWIVSGQTPIDCDNGRSR
jgi:hypothetical protein